MRAILRAWIKQLLEQAEKVAPSEVPEFRTEVNKRLKAMKEEE
ncbi:hypothetical protein HpHCM72_02600 [Helicobacter pylori]